MAGSGRPAAREAGMLKKCPVAAPAAARGRCMAGPGRPTAVSYTHTRANATREDIVCRPLHDNKHTDQERDYFMQR